MMRKSKDTIDLIGQAKQSSKGFRPHQGAIIHQRNKSTSSGQGSISKRSKKKVVERESYEPEGVRRNTPQKSRLNLGKSSSTILNLIKSQLGGGAQVGNGQYRSSRILATNSVKPVKKKPLK